MVLLDGDRRMAALLASPAAARLGLRLAGASQDVSTLLDLLNEHRIHLALVDVPTDEASASPVGVIARAKPGLPVVGLVDRGTTTVSARTALAQGATGLLDRDATLDEVAASLALARTGGLVLPARLRAALLGVPDDVHLDALTPLQRQLLSLLTAGLDNRAIARRVHVSERTAKRLLTGLFGALGVQNRTAAAAIGALAGLADADPPPRPHDDGPGPAT